MKHIYVSAVVFTGLLALLFFLLRSFDKRNETHERPVDKKDVNSNLSIASATVVQLTIDAKKWKDGDYRTVTSVIRKKSDGVWRMVEPFDYPVNRALVNEMVNALGAIEWIKSDSRTPVTLRELQLDEMLGINISVKMQARTPFRFVIGISRDSATYLRLPDSSQVYLSPGNLRKVFNRTPAQLRNREITNFDRGSVMRASFVGSGEAFTLVRTDKYNDGRIVPLDVDVLNFDAERALVKVEALATLNTKGFYDESIDSIKQGWTKGDVLQVILEVREEGRQKTVELLFGPKDKQTGLHYVTTSAKPQVFLVSSHMKPLFQARSDDFKRTDDEMRRYNEWIKKAAAHAKEHERAH